MIKEQTNTVLKNSFITLLPTLINFNDVRNLLRLLKKKNTPVSVVEITDVFLRRLFDPEKLLIYEEWGIVKNQNNLISLTETGIELANCSDREAEIYQKILKNITLYHSALEWIWAQGKSLVTYTEIVAFWKENYSEPFFNKDEKSGENPVITFFNLCHFAELGLATLGRKGQPTRFNTDREELKSFLEKDFKFPIEKTFPQPARTNKNNYLQIVNGNSARTFISADKNSKIVSDIRNLLDFAEVESEIMIRSKSENLLAENAIRLMRKCSAAIIVADERNQILYGGKNRLNDEMLGEIIAAYTMFEGRVILIWQGDSPPEISLKDLEIFHIKSDGLCWETGLEIGQSVKEFKKISSFGKKQELNY